MRTKAGHLLVGILQSFSGTSSLIFSSRRRSQKYAAPPSWKDCPWASCWKRHCQPHQCSTQQVTQTVGTPISYSQANPPWVKYSQKCDLVWVKTGGNALSNHYTQGVPNWIKYFENGPNRNMFIWFDLRKFEKSDKKILDLKKVWVKNVWVRHYFGKWK